MTTKESEIKTYTPLLSCTEIELLQTIKDSNLGVYSIEIDREFCGLYRVDFDASDSGKNLSLKIRDTNNFRALDIAHASPILDGIEAINASSFDLNTKKRLLYTLHSNRADTYESFMKNGQNDAKLFNGHKKSLEAARNKAQELLTLDPSIKALDQKDVSMIINSMIYDATRVEEVKPNRTKLIVGILAASASLYLYKKFRRD